MPTAVRLRPEQDGGPFRYRDSAQFHFACNARNLLEGVQMKLAIVGCGYVVDYCLKTLRLHPEP